MTRSKFRAIKAAYRELHGINQVNDWVVYFAYVGEFATNQDFVDYLNANVDKIDEMPVDPESFDAHGNWALAHSDMALGVHVVDGFYFWRKEFEPAGNR